MLEIASEIVICLLLAALIGFAIGYLVGKSQLKKSTPQTEIDPQRKIEDVVKEEELLQKDSAIQEIAYSEEVEIPTEDTIETPIKVSKVIEKRGIEEKKDKKTLTKKTIEEESLFNESMHSEDIEIPTEHAIEQALQALEALEEIEESKVEIIQENADKEQKPELLSEPRNGEKDNLTQIKGVGPKVEEKLNALGIYHFEQIANWSEANMLWLEAHTLFASRDKKELWISESKSFL
jgi:predicted flap endonuclease-1-like 5' DNA nuclease